MRSYKLIISLAFSVIAATFMMIYMAGCGQQKAEINKQKELARLVVDEAWNKGNLGVLDEQVAPDFVYHQSPFPDIKGVEAYKKFIQDNRTAYPDIRITLEDVIVEGDRVVSRGTYTGTQKGISPTLGISTGKPVNFNLCTVARTANGKIVEEWAYVDWLGFMQQIGYKMSPPVTQNTFARVHINQVKPEKLEESLKVYREGIVPVIKSQKGFRGIYSLNNFKTGKSLSITIWDSEAEAIANTQTGDYKAVVDKVKSFLTAKEIREGYSVTVQE